MRWCALCLVCACKVLPPPPVLPPHAGTAPDPVGSTTAMLVFGFAGEIPGGGGVGLALRVEHQQWDTTTAGFEITGGKGDEMIYEGRNPFRTRLLAVRAYGRTAYRRDTELAVMYGAGLSWQATGLVTATLNLGGAASYPGDHVIPYGALGLALAIPLRHGRAYADEPMPAFMFGEAEPRMPGNPLPPPPGPEYRTPGTELFVALDLGLGVPFGATGNRASIDLTGALATRTNAFLIAGSLADAQRF